MKKTNRVFIFMVAMISLPAFSAAFSGGRVTSPKAELTIEQLESGYRIGVREQLDSGRWLQSRLGEEFRCSEGPYADGSNPKLTIISCEKALTETSFILVNIYPSELDKALRTAEFELYDSSLGTVVYHSYGTDFSPVSL